MYVLDDGGRNEQQDAVLAYRTWLENAVGFKLTAIVLEELPAATLRNYLRDVSYSCAIRIRR